MSSADHIPAGETKAERERRVFSFFAADAFKYAGLTIRDGTINSRESPEPDILCDIVGEGAVAFEMTEILDQASKQVMATMMSAREALVGTLSTLPVSDQLKFQAKFASKEIKVEFLQDKPLRDLEAIIPKLYEWLIHVVTDDTHGDSVQMPTDLEMAIRHVAILSPGPPFIDITLKLSMADQTTTAVTRKLTGKQYATTAPIELLVYAHDQPLIQYEAWRSSIAAAIVPLIDASIARGHIRRVWIYSIGERYTERALKFVYPEWRAARADESP